MAVSKRRMFTIMCWNSLSYSDQMSVFGAQADVFEELDVLDVAAAETKHWRAEKPGIIPGIKTEQDRIFVRRGRLFCAFAEIKRGKKTSLFTFSTAPPESLVSLRRFSWLDRSENNLKTSCQLNGFYTKHTLTQFLRNSVHSSVI